MFYENEYFDDDSSVIVDSEAVELPTRTRSNTLNVKLTNMTSFQFLAPDDDDSSVIVDIEAVELPTTLNVKLTNMTSFQILAPDQLQSIPSFIPTQTPDPVPLSAVKTLVIITPPDMITTTPQRVIRTMERNFETPERILATRNFPVTPEFTAAKTPNFNGFEHDWIEDPTSFSEFDLEENQEINVDIDGTKPRLFWSRSLSYYSDNDLQDMVQPSIYMTTQEIESVSSEGVSNVMDMLCITVCDVIAETLGIDDEQNILSFYDDFEIESSTDKNGERYTIVFNDKFCTMYMQPLFVDHKLHLFVKKMEREIRDRLNVKPFLGRFSKVDFYTLSFFIASIVYIIQTVNLCMIFGSSKEKGLAFVCTASAIGPVVFWLRAQHPLAKIRIMDICGSSSFSPKSHTIFVAGCVFTYTLASIGIVVNYFEYPNTTSLILLVFSGPHTLIPSALAATLSIRDIFFPVQFHVPFVAFMVFDANLGWYLLLWQVYKRGNLFLWEACVGIFLMAMYLFLMGFYGASQNWSKKFPALLRRLALEGEWWSIYFLMASLFFISFRVR